MEYDVYETKESGKSIVIARYKRISSATSFCSSSHHQLSVQPKPNFEKARLFRASHFKPQNRFSQTKILYSKACTIHTSSLSSANTTTMSSSPPVPAPSVPEHLAWGDRIEQYIRELAEVLNNCPENDKPGFIDTFAGQYNEFLNFEVEYLSFRVQYVQEQVPTYPALEELNIEQFRYMHQQAQTELNARNERHKAANPGPHKFSYYTSAHGENEYSENKPGETRKYDILCTPVMCQRGEDDCQRQWVTCNSRPISWRRNLGWDSGNPWHDGYIQSLIDNGHIKRKTGDPHEPCCTQEDYIIDETKIDPKRFF